jgi:hypothetical protein
MAGKVNRISFNERRRTVSTIFATVLFLYGLYLMFFGIRLLTGTAYLGGSSVPYLAPGIALVALSIGLWFGGAWPVVPAFLASLVPGVWPFLWDRIAAGFAPPPPFLWRELLPLVAPAVVGAMGVVHAAVGGGATRNETAIRSIAKVYAAALLPYGLFLMGQGIWILLTVHLHAPVHMLSLVYAAPGAVLTALSVFFWLGHAWPAVPTLAASMVPGIWPILWWSIATGRTPVHLGWEGILTLAAPAAFAAITAMLVAMKVSHRHG